MQLIVNVLPSEQVWLSLEFRSNNDVYQPLVEAIAFLKHSPGTAGV